MINDPHQFRLLPQVSSVLYRPCAIPGLSLRPTWRRTPRNYEHTALPSCRNPRPPAAGVAESFLNTPAHLVCP
jgi:hypothetical protein